MTKDNTIITTGIITFKNLHKVNFKTEKLNLLYSTLTNDDTKVADFGNVIATKDEILCVKIDEIEKIKNDNGVVDAIKIEWDKVSKKLDKQFENKIIDLDNLEDKDVNLDEVVDSINKVANITINIVNEANESVNKVFETLHKNLKVMGIK